jgi:hypothetical protein
MISFSTFFKKKWSPSERLNIVQTDRQKTCLPAQTGLRCGRQVANPEGGFPATRDLSRGTAKKCARPIAHHISFHKHVIA